MQRRHLILSLGLIAVIGAGLWASRTIAVRREHVAIARAGVAPLPDLGRWPAELRQRIAQEGAAVSASDSPAVPLAQLALLYWANGYAPEAERALTALRRLEPHQARWPYLQADLRWRAGDDAGAEKGFEATVAEDPHYAPAWLRLGDLQVKRRAIEQARTSYAQARSAAPDLLRATYAQIYFEATHGGDRNTTMQRLAELARAHPGIREVHELLAGMLADRDPVAAARERRTATETDLALGTEDPWLDELATLCYDSNRLMLRAVALRREGRMVETEKLLTQVMQLAPLQPANPLGWELLSDLYLKLERPAEARAVLEKAVAFFPDEPEMTLLLTRLLCTTHQPDAAIPIMQAAVRRWPKRGDLQAALGLALHGAGNYGAAVTALSTALRLNPTLTEAQYQLGLSLLENGQQGAARAALAQALVMRPDYPEALFALAAVELDAGDYVAAEPHVFKVYALDHEEPNAQRLVASWHLLKGLAAVSAGNLADAAQQYQTGLAVMPDFPLLLKEAGTLAQRRALWPEAVDLFEHYVRLKPEDPQGYLSLGQALEASGRTLDATAAWQRGLQAARAAGDTGIAEEFTRRLGR